MRPRHPVFQRRLNALKAGLAQRAVKGNRMGMKSALFLLAVFVPNLALGQTPARPPASIGTVVAVMGKKAVDIQPILDGSDVIAWRVDLRPERNYLGDCRTQRLIFYLKEPPSSVARQAGETAELDHIAVFNRFRREQWIRHDGHEDCGSPADGSWTRAPDDLAFGAIAPVVRQVYRMVSRGSQLADYPFQFNCIEAKAPCREPEARLKEAFALGLDEAELNNGVLTIQHAPGSGRQYVMRFPQVRWTSPILRVDLEFSPGEAE
jgi:hypothetical protein